MTTTSSLKNHFLIAMPGIADPVFNGALIYVCEHNEEGSMGIVVNKPLEITWANVFQKIAQDGFKGGDEPVLIGGPVQVERGFVLHRKTSQRWESTMTVSDHLDLTTSSDVIAALSTGEGPSKALIALGYAGWEQGQLDQEIANNVWLSLPADEEILFNTPHQDKAAAAAKTLGVDLSLLSAESGHA